MAKFSIEQPGREPREIEADFYTVSGGSFLFWKRTPEKEDGVRNRLIAALPDFTKVRKISESGWHHFYDRLRLRLPHGEALSATKSDSPLHLTR